MKQTEMASLLARPAYIFDLDGVLVDTAVFHFKAWRRLANSLGFDFTVAQNEQLKGVSRVESLNKILNWGGVVCSEAEKQELAEMKNSWYLEMVHEMTDADVLPGVLPFLNLARARHKKIGLGSASKNAPLILKQTGLDILFDVIVDGNAVSKSKPDPEVFVIAAQRLALDPRYCIVFEDAQAGIDAALAAGMAAVGIGEKSVLRGAHYVVTGFRDLLPAYD